MPYAKLGELNLYYELHGAGEPLILLHGGLGSIELFCPGLDALAAHRRVIAVELQGHGRTADIDRPMSFEHMADDLGGLIAHLGLPAVDVMGYSLGAGAAIQTAIRHRDRVGKLVVVSAPFCRDAWFPEVLAGMAQVENLSELLRKSPLYANYARLAPRVEDWPRLLAKSADLLGRDYDWTAQIAALPPTLLVYADADSIRPAHMVEAFAALGGGLHDAGWDGRKRPASQLAILPGTTHYDIGTSPALVAAVLPFLAG